MIPHHTQNILLAILLVFGLQACNGSSKDGASADSDKAKAEYAEKMAEEHKDDKPVQNEASQGDPGDTVEAKDVEYATIDDKKIKGYWAQPKTGEPKAAIIVIHEWWGLNDNVRAMTRKLAAEGYMALAVDLYEGESADKPDGAMALMKKSQGREDKLKSNLSQAIAFVEGKGASKIGTIGWCFGGGWSLKTALLAPDKVNATVIYYGHLTNDEEQLKTLNMPILGIFGALDKGIPVDGVKAFEATLKKLEKDASIHIYENADHAFANPSGTRYQKEAAEDAWAKTSAFFQKHLQ